MKPTRHFLVPAIGLGVLCTLLLWASLPTLVGAAPAAGQANSVVQGWLKPPKPTKKPPKPTKMPPATPTLDLALPTLTMTLTLLPPLPTPEPPTATPTATATEIATLAETPTLTSTPTTPAPLPTPSLPPMPSSTPTVTPPVKPTLTSTVTPTVMPTMTPTVMPTVTFGELHLTKTDLLANDADANNLVSPGDTLLYVIVASNAGSGAVQQLLLLDTLDVYTTLVVGSVQTDLGVVRQGNSPGDSTVAIELGTLAPGHRAIMSLQVIINAGVGATQLQNQASATFANPANGPGGQTVLLSDDPDTEAKLDTTMTPLNANLPAPDYQLFLPISLR